MKIESVVDLDDKTYFAFACFSVKDKDTLQNGEIGFAVSSMDDASSHEILDISMVVATGETSAAAVSDD